MSQRQWQAGAAKAVVLARGDQSPDALSGVPLAAHVHGPLLLTDPQVLDEATRSEIDRVLGGPGSKKTVYILGGFSAVSSNVETGLRNAGYQVVRYAGGDRYRTSLAIAVSFGPTTHVIAATGGEHEVSYGRTWHVITTPGRDFPDALSAGPLGAVEDAPVVLTSPSDTEVSAFLLTNHQVIEAVGGDAADLVARLLPYADKTAVYLVGPDRYSTGAAVAARIAAVTGRTPTSVGIASGVAFPDALTGGALAANAGAPLLLTDPVALPDSTRGLLASWAPQLAEITVFGGTAAIPTRTFQSIVDAVHGRAG